jgi:pimeloyl-ACP methyl ester carboxylesterase
MGGLNVLAFAGLHPRAARAAIAIDVAITSTNRRDRYVRRLKALPTVTYSDLATAKARFRLMPKEGNIPASTLAMIAEHSLRETDGGGFTFKFDRESFFGSDGLDAKAAVAHSPIPLLLVRAELSRIMTAEAARDAVKSNPAAHLVEISGVHHHLLLERPDLLAAALRSFVNGLGL